MIRRALLCLFVLTCAWAQTPDLTRQPTVYVVGYAHLDTQWRWEYPQTISEYIRNTMHDNFGVYDGMKVWEFLDFFAVAYKIGKAKRKQVINDVLELLARGLAPRDGGR